MSTVMLARIGPVKPILAKYLITHSEACGRPRAATRSHSDASAGARPGVGAYRAVSAVSAEIVDGALPEKRLSPRLLRHNVPVCTPNSAGAPHDGAGRTGALAW